MGLELTVVAFFKRVEQVGRCVSFTIVFHFFIALKLDGLAVFQGEAVGGVFQIFLGDQHALEGFRVKAECGSTFQAFFGGIQVDIFKVFVIAVGWDIDGFRD